MREKLLTDFIAYWIVAFASIGASPPLWRERSGSTLRALEAQVREMPRAFSLLASCDPQAAAAAASRAVARNS